MHFSTSSASVHPSSFFHNSYNNNNNMQVPHRGSLFRVVGDQDMHYVLDIMLEDETTYELHFQRQDYDFSERLFSIMDTESKGQVARNTVQEFVTLRCPVFWRRDEDLQDFNNHDGFSGEEAPKGSSGCMSSPTFDEVWRAVATCSKSPRITPKEYSDHQRKNRNNVELGVEGWMVFCRFIALAQYLEAKRRFSGRHLQQMMRHRNAPRGSEVVVVDVPPMAPPLPLSPSQLAQYERESSKYLPLPELDLDHSLLAAHDVMRRRKSVSNSMAPGTRGGGGNRGGRGASPQGHVKITLFGSLASMLHSSTSSHTPVEFCLNYTRNTDGMGNWKTPSEPIVVRRSMADMKWLNDTFTSHKVLGGTLCGRILPPFPGSHSRFSLASQFPGADDSSLTSTGTAIAAAAAGVGMIKEGMKSLWGSYLKPSSSGLPLSSNSSSSQSKSDDGTSSSSTPKKRMSSMSCVLPESYYNPNSPAGKARQLERYLNYLLEHPALSTSFPLNTILRASQSGLEAAKQCLEEHSRVAKEIKEHTPQLDDGKLLTFWPLHGPGSSNSQPNLSWVRTAAQAAMALKVHGILETTGLPSASARLQHASLPSFGNPSRTGVAWREDDEGDARMFQEAEQMDGCSRGGEESFEEGVLHVSDELEPDAFAADDTAAGYDLLPLPVPAPERRILTVGDPHSDPSFSNRETRFRYGSPTLRGRLPLEHEDDINPAYLGEIVVDENIDKLREVIGSVDNTLSRCLASSGGIGRARRESLALHLEIIRGVDSWEGLRGQFVSQRALLKGVSGIEQSRDVFEESDIALIHDVSWQTALASSAVSAAEDVRSAVRAARTAGNAKAAASSAAFTAQTACESGKFNSIDEARAAQTRASIAQSHAIHAAVVEHEAKTVKRRATLALAHDVKCWNVHRKREILQTCIAYARSQHEATRRAVDAWSCLRDGYVGSTVILARKSVPPPARANPNNTLETSFDDVTATIYQRTDTKEGRKPVIVVVEHDLFKQPTILEASSSGDDILSTSSPENALPLVMASPVLDEEPDYESHHSPEDIAASLNSQGFGTSWNSHGGVGSSTLDAQAFCGSANKTPNGAKIIVEETENEVLTSSLQSLVDGLMNWGGQYDSEEDFALPTGMAASIALEESVVLSSHKGG